MAHRHEAVFEAIDSAVGNSKAAKLFRILEIGVYDGENAVQMIKHANKRGRNSVGYWGVDLFEDLTPEKSAEEMSKSKLPPSIMEVRRRISKVTDNSTVYKGISYEEIADNANGGRLPHMDVIFIDGGHSLDTIARDWMAIQWLIHDKTQIVLDDYYRNRDDFGCARLVNFLATDPNYVVKIHDHVDRIEHNGLQISTVTITKVGEEPYPIPKSVYGQEDWSDAPKMSPDPRLNFVKEILPPVSVTDPAVAKAMEGKEGPEIFTPSADGKQRVYSIEKDGAKELSGDDAFKHELHLMDKFNEATALDEVKPIVLGTTPTVVPLAVSDEVKKELEKE